VQALVLTPTRELAIQVAEEIHSFVSDRSIKVLPIYGGQPYTLQINNLRAGVDIVVGTPGRIIDHLQNNKLDISNLTYLILDEADEMLNM
jgi:ATP-dependent RNA helicase DeaD